MTPEVACSVPEHDEIRDTGEVFHVPRDERRLGNDGRRRDQEVHRREEPHSRARGLPCGFPEKIDQERGVEVDQRAAGLVACVRRRRTSRSMARRVSADI